VYNSKILKMGVENKNALFMTKGEKDNMYHHGLELDSKNDQRSINAGYSGIMKINN
jgi:hypothetical protein